MRGHASGTCSARGDRQDLTDAPRLDPANCFAVQDMEAVLGVNALRLLVEDARVLGQGEGDNALGRRQDRSLVGRTDRCAVGRKPGQAWATPVRLGRRASIQQVVVLDQAKEPVSAPLATLSSGDAAKRDAERDGRFPDRLDRPAGGSARV
jgi:hypothetical protein